MDAAAQSDVISIEPLINGYCIAIVRDDFIDAFADLDEVEYIEKPKRLYLNRMNNGAVCEAQSMERNGRIYE